MRYSKAKITHLLAIIALSILSASFFQSEVVAQKSSGNNNGKTANHSSASRLSIEQLRNMLIELTSQKGASIRSVQDSKTESLLNLKFNCRYNWHGSIGMVTNNDNIVYLIFPCRQIDPKDNREEYLQRLLAGNQGLGLLRFEVSKLDMVKLILPLNNEGLTVEKLNRSIQLLIDTAESTSDIWSNQPAKKEVASADDMPTGSEPPSGSEPLRIPIPISGSAPPGTGDSVPGTSPVQENPGRYGTTPTEASTPSAGTVPYRPELKISSSDICKDGNMRIGTMSMKDSSNFGTIIFGPDGSFAGTITNAETTSQNKDKGTWKVVDGQLELTITSGDKIQFKTKSKNNGEIKVITTDGFIEITLPKTGE